MYWVSSICSYLKFSWFNFEIKFCTILLAMESLFCYIWKHQEIEEFSKKAKIHDPLNTDILKIKLKIIKQHLEPVGTQVRIGPQ